MDKVQILIVEDEAIVSLELRYNLESFGLRVPVRSSSAPAGRARRDSRTTARRATASAR